MLSACQPILNVIITPAKHPELMTSASKELLVHAHFNILKDFLLFLIWTFLIFGRVNRRFFGRAPRASGRAIRYNSGQRATANALRGFRYYRSRTLLRKVVRHHRLNHDS